MNMNCGCVDKCSCGMSFYNMTSDTLSEIMEGAIKRITISDLKRISVTEWNKISQQPEPRVILSASVDGQTRGLPISQVKSYVKGVTTDVDSTTGDSSGIPLGFTMFSPFDLGAEKNGWVKMGTTINRENYTDFFEEVLDTVGVFTSLDTWTLPSSSGKFFRGATTQETGIAPGSNTPAEGGQDNFTVGSENLDPINVEITDPGHSHSINIVEGVRSEPGSGTLAYINGGGSISETDIDKTGITASVETGSGGNGAAVPIDNRPKFTTRYEYMKVKYVA